MQLSYGGKGWILSRHLLQEPIWRQKYEQLKRAFDDLQNRFDQRVEQQVQQLHKEIEEL